MSNVTPPTARALLALLAPALGVVSACKPDGGLTKFNSPPEAQITAPAPDDAALAGTALTLRGAASDPNHDTDSLSTRWFVDGAEACAAAPPAADGTTTCEITVPTGTGVEIRLEVIDPEGAAGTASQSLAITPNAAPTVTIAAPLADDVHYSDQLITFRGTVADAEDPADALTVWWEDGATRLDAVEATPNASGEVLGYAALAEGPHALELHARDSAGNESIATVLIDVGPPNTAPACAFTAPVDGGASEAGERVDLRATVSDPDVPADRLRVDWSSDKDGPLGNSTPDSAGLVAFSTGDLSVDTHRLTLTVQDEVGATCTTALTWTVGTPPSIVLEAPLDGEVVNEGEALTFTALVTDGEDVPGDLWVTWESDIDGVFAEGPPDSAGVAETVETSLTRGSHRLTATVTDTTGLFTQARLGFVVNGPPVISALTITPNPAANDSTLSCTASATDPDGGAPSLAYAWTNTTRGTSLGSGPSLTLTSALAAPGDTLTCAATATDGDGGSATASATVTISNRPPVATATLSPSSGVTRTSTLTCTGSATDADADPTSLSFAWTVNGAPVSASSSAASLSTLAGAFVAGQLVACTVTANDGKGGADTDTAQVTVGNTAPVVGTVSLSPSAPATNDTLTANTSTSDADGDALSVRYDWTVGSSVVQSGPSNALIGAYFSRGDRVFVVVTADDGTTTTSATSPTVTVANTAPGAPGVEITPAAPEAGDSLVCAVTTPSADADGDALAYQFAWEVDGVAYTGATDSATESVVDGADVGGAETWTCEVVASDGAAVSVAGMDEVEVENTCGTADVTVSASGINFVTVCAQTFNMGCTAGQSSCESDESPIMPVTLTNDFFLSQTEITQGQYTAMMGSNPSWFPSCGSTCPVETITWSMAAAFANAVSAAEGLTACYTCTGSGASVSCTSVADPYGCEGYRLPTEAEWEAAARCGQDNLYAGGSVIADVAWYNGNTSGSPKPVAGKAANSCGLYDMSGNVWEWTQDRYSAAYYTSSGRTDPTGASSGLDFIPRGGSWYDGASMQRAANRHAIDARARPNVGLRLARTAP